MNCYEKDFIDVIQKKKIVCFGAGNELKRICSQYPQIVDKIHCIFDNNKHGTPMNINDRFIPIVPFSHNSILKNEFIGVISTVSYADEIIRQLDDCAFLDGMSVFFPFFFKTKEEEMSIASRPDLLIPKKIHYCWFGNNDIPKQFLENIETWKRYCPDYEIIKWDEDNYDISKNTYMKQAYNARKWGFVPDYARLDIIHQEGGIYLDTDVELLKPLDDLLGFKMFCGFERNEYVALGLGFGGIPGNPILEEMMLQYDHMSFINLDGSLNMTASPVYQTTILKKHGLECNGRFQMVNECAVFPKEYFAPIDSFGWGYISSKTYSIHKYAATWFDKPMQEQKERMLRMVSKLTTRMIDYNS